MTFTSYRSALYVPADHDRAMAKSTALDADMIIYDLEDGVAPERKDYAREQVISVLKNTTDTTRIVRVNHRSTTAYSQDINRLIHSHACGIMLSKASSVADINDLVSFFAKYDRADISVWCNVETPIGVANAFDIASHPNVVGLVAGTNDLANDLRIVRTPDRAGLLHSLQRIQLAARAYGKIALDGTFVDFNDEAGLKAEADQGRMLGFDGKTLVHPKQIMIANAAFSPSDAELEEAHKIIDTYEEAMGENKAVTLMDGRMIERLHYDRAKEMLKL